LKTTPKDLRLEGFSKRLAVNDDVKGRASDTVKTEAFDYEV